MLVLPAGMQVLERVVAVADVGAVVVVGEVGSGRGAGRGAVGHGVRVGARLAARVGAEDLGVPLAEEGSEGGHGARDDGEVDFDGGPDVGDVVVSRFFAEVEEAVDVDDSDDGDDWDAEIQQD